VSKLIDLLRKGGGEIADVISPLIDASAPRNRPADRAFRSEAAAEEERPAPAMPVAPPPVEPLRPKGVRRLGLRVAAPSPLLPFENGHWQPSEQYRILRTKISQHPKHPSLILITSPGPGDGKTVSAINTAAALSLRRDERVLLLDADLRKSSVHVQLGLPNSPGLAEVIEGSCALEEALVHTQEFPNLYVMSAGRTPANPAELLDSARWHSICAQLRATFRYTIIDSPPVGGIADYELIQAICDGVILVLRPDYTNRALCLNALKLMPEMKFLGVVLNCTPDWRPGRHASSEYYYYSSEKPHGDSESGGTPAREH
jgi:capsular exopolysaccharide synthesis family protein